MSWTPAEVFMWGSIVRGRRATRPRGRHYLVIDGAECTGSQRWLTRFRKRMEREHGSIRVQDSPRLRVLDLRFYDPGSATLLTSP